MCLGHHVVKTWSGQQKVVALSSAEAELHAVVAASSEALGLRSLSHDMGIELGAEINVDSSAAMGIVQRAGIGRVRHLHIQSLWVQECRSSGRLSYRKVLGSLNPSDVLAQHVQSELLGAHMKTLGAEVRGGRAEAAPSLDLLEVVCVKIGGSEDLETEVDGQIASEAKEKSKGMGRSSGNQVEAGKADIRWPVETARWADLTEAEAPELGVTVDCIGYVGDLAGGLGEEGDLEFHEFADFRWDDECIEGSMPEKPLLNDSYLRASTALVAGGVEGVDYRKRFPKIFNYEKRMYVANFRALSSRGGPCALRRALLGQ